MGVRASASSPPLVVPFVMGEWKPLVSFGLLLAFWIIASVVASLIHRLRSSGKQGCSRNLRRNRAAITACMLAHLGIAVFIIGVTLVKGYETEKDVRMDIGDTVEVGGYTFRFNGVKKGPGPNYVARRGNVAVSAQR